MKKLTLLLSTLLVLVSSIVFCSCGNNYKNLKIECDVEEVELVMGDGEDNSRTELDFKISGVKSWGEVDINSSPLGLVRVKYVIEDKHCYVGVEALQPTNEGASLTIKHLGSGKSLSLPLKIGMKLKSIESNGNNYVVEIPNEQDNEFEKTVDIKSSEVLNCDPLNYTDKLVWLPSNSVEGAEVVSYLENGEITHDVFASEEVEEKAKYNGTSEAVKSVIKVTNFCENGSELILHPVTVVKGVAILHKDISVTVKFVKLLRFEDIRVESPSHNVIDEDGVEGDQLLGDLILISNPENNVRRVSGLSADYNYYSTAVINLKYNDSDRGYVDLTDNSVRDIYSIYKLDISTDIDNLLIDTVDVGSFRVTATENCVGKGSVFVKIVPNKSAGEIAPIEIAIPCEVGEISTGILGKRFNETIQFLYNADLDQYVGTSVLTDDYSNTHGQRFNFEVLGTNTLSALKNYRIVINKNLLYINDLYTSENVNKYIRTSDGEDYDISTLSGFKYQISIRKDGKEMYFHDAGDNFVSEVLNAGNTLYIKYYIDDQKAENTNFDINIQNIYDGRYNVENSGLETTCISYKLNFDRKRKIEVVGYNPADARKGENAFSSQAANPNWQFYFTTDMLVADETGDRYYGIAINEVLGINNTILTQTELSEIGLTISVEKSDGGKSNIGVGTLNNSGEIEFASTHTYNYISEYSNSNFIAFGKIGDDEIEKGDYRLVISQYGEEIVSKNITVYKELQEDDIHVDLPNSDFDGKTYLDMDNCFIISASEDSNKAYEVRISVEDKEFVNHYDLNYDISIVPTTTDASVLGANYLRDNFFYNGMTHKILTGEVGSYNTETNENNYIKIKYTFTVDQYDYYQKKDAVSEIAKEIYIFIYEPMLNVGFNKTNIYKYDYVELSILNGAQVLYENEFSNQYSKETLTIELNSPSVYNYVNISWQTNSDGILDYNIATDKRSANFTFTSSSLDSLTSIITATVKQFGVEIPIYCRFVVSKPNLTEKVILNNVTYSLKTGENYLSLRDNASLQINAENYSSKGAVSLEGLKYIITNSNGYDDNTVASVDANGLITTYSAGKAKLIIVAMDCLINDLSNIVNYFRFTTYVKNNAYLLVDLIVADGTEDNPYLIANATDLKGINNDLTKHYALITDINLTGDAINFTEFTGGLTSYQESSTSNNRFEIYGLELNQIEQSMYLFERLGQDAYIKNIDFYVTFNYVVKNNNEAALIGLVKENYGYIKDITINVLGSVYGNELKSDIYVGTISAKNHGTVEISEPSLVGVQGSIVIDGCVNANVIVGGVIAENQGQIIGALLDENAGETNDELSYEVYYGSQGAIADVTIQVKATNLNNTEKSALGGIVGKNLGSVLNVYSTGQVKGHDDSSNLLVDNVGGIIGYNHNNGKFEIMAKTSTSGTSGTYMLDQVDFSDQTDYQVVNSYSTMKVVGRNNVGGAVGLDKNGVYKKVYYEIYTENETLISGYNNVGGLIGKAVDSNLYYSYVNSFVWGYLDSPKVFELEGNQFVGGLIGLAESSGNMMPSSDSEKSKGLHVANSLASITINANSQVSGLIGRMNGFGGIYTAYFYGSVNNQLNANGIVGMYIGNLLNSVNLPYNNVYSIINGYIKVNDVFNYPAISLLADAQGFGLKSEYNNAYPYIIYGEDDANLVSIVPTIVTIKDAFYINSIDSRLEKVVYAWENGTYMRYEMNDEGKYTRYDKLAGEYIELNPSLTQYTANVYTSMFEQNSFGEYVLDDENYRLYNHDMDQGKTRYTLRADIARTEDSSSTDSDYREDVLVLYYYQFKSLSDSNATNDMRKLNTFDMHKLLNDLGINVKPNTSKRFVLTSSNDDVVSVLANGKLLLRKEGTATITLTSALNKNATASFMVVVRSKVLNFGLYSSANTFDEYNISEVNINVVKNSSKIIYADYSSSVEIYNRVYDYESATNIELDFHISISEGTLEEGKEIANYISLNGTKNGELYTIGSDAPITISAHDYFDGVFAISARPYVIIDYVNGTYTEKLRVALSDSFVSQFYVITKKGVTSINTDTTYIEMMPSDEADVNIEIGADIKVNEVKVDLYAQDADGNAQSNGVDYSEMIDIYYNNSKIENNIINIISDLEFIDNGEIQLQKLKINIVPNQNAYYLAHEFKVQITLKAIDGDNNEDNDVSTIMHVVVKPQQISSLIALSYRNEGEIKELEDGKLSNIIRPGSRNILVIDIAPNIAIFDYIEIEDLTSSDVITFMQLDRKLNSVSAGQVSSSGKGIKATKLAVTDSTLYVSAILPLTARANTTHLIKITAYDSNGKILKVTNMSLEAVLYPTIIMTYTDPKGVQTVVDTRNGGTNNVSSTDIDLAMGVEAPIMIDTINIDEQSLKYSVVVKGSDNQVEEDLNNYISFAFENDSYVLRFKQAQKDNWKNLLGKKIEVTFTAEKSLNGVTEKSTAIINFTIRRIVIHGVSITHSDLQGNKLVGDYNSTFEAQFYFSKNDVSYYDMNNNRYWSQSYTLANTGNNSSDNDLLAINKILKTLNSPQLNDQTAEIKFVNSNSEYPLFMNRSLEILDASGALQIQIINKDNMYHITANDKSNVNSSAIKVQIKIRYEDNRPILIDGGNIIKAEFGFNITPKSSVLEERLKVESVEEFLGMQEGKFYELTTDLLLEEYMPLSTNIGGLDGKGHTITIANFDVSSMAGSYSDGVAYIGLFGTLNEDCIIENLQVDYNDHGKNVTIDLSGETLTSGNTYTNVYFGGIAGLNLGVITNVNVGGKIKILASQIVATNMYVGGIAGFNGSSSTATKLATITNSTIQLGMESLALIGGVTSTNNGKISNTIFNGDITCWQTSAYAATIYNGGIAVDNYGSIALSGVLGGNDRGNLKSVGNIGGFVANNRGKIANGFVNKINITAQGDIGGFVHQNTGEIKLCYAYAELVTSRFYETFIRNTSSYGTIMDCYAIGGSIGQQGGIEGLKVLTEDKYMVADSYTNFVFAESQYGIWSIGDNGPELVSAGFDASYKGYNIYDVITFEGYLDGNSYNSSEGRIVINNSFRIVRDIDLSSLLDNPITHDLIVASQIEGNCMTISGYNIYNNGSVDSIGLFGSLKQDNEGKVYVRNLNISPQTIRASGSALVGGLAGEIDSVNLYNITIDNSGLMILGKNVVGGIAGIIKGHFEIIGLSSNVSVFAVYTSGDQNYNLYTGKNVTNNSYIDNISVVSYSGAIAGIINGYSYGAFNSTNRNYTHYSKVSNIQISHDVVLVAETVGGAFGLVGECTLVKNISHDLNSNAKFQAVYVAGGLVGENRGVVIDSNIYSSETSDTKECFNRLTVSSGGVVGGIVGLNIGGLVHNSISQVDVYSSLVLGNVGGIVGRNISGTISRCTFNGTVNGYFAGGIAGADYSYTNTINSNITNNSLSVYKNVAKPVTYTMEDSQVNVRYHENIVTSGFINKFINSQSNYYTFNDAYDPMLEDKLVIPQKVFGLMVGFANENFKFGDDSIKLSDTGIVISIGDNVTNDNKVSCEATYNDHVYNIDTIQNIISEDINILDGYDFTILYIIGFNDVAKYQDWNVLLNYSDKHIVCSKASLVA